MINDEKIKESAKYYAEENSMAIEDQMGDVYDAFKAGVKWATSEFLENLWHTYSEEPLKDAELISITCGEYRLHENKYFKEDYPDWSEFVQLYEVMYWAYKEDLLSGKVINSEKDVHRLSEKYDNDYEELALGVKKEIYNEILKSIWHPASEEPKERDKLLLVEIGKKEKQYVCFKRKQGIFGGSWRTYISLVDATRWAYLDDLFPKEGGEK